MPRMTPLTLLLLAVAVIVDSEAAGTDLVTGARWSTPTHLQIVQAGSGATKVLDEHLTRAHRGENSSIEAIVRLAGGGYINSAEGGEFLNATFMALLITHPVAFLSAVVQQDKAVRERVIRELRSPVHDAYAADDLLAAIRFAIDRGQTHQLVAELERVLADLARREGDCVKKSRDDLDAAAAACLASGGQQSGEARGALYKGDRLERGCARAVAMARENLSTSPHDPVVGAIAIDLADFVESAQAKTIFRSRSFKLWACAGADFYHRAMAQYQRYRPRSRSALDRICPKQSGSPR